MCGKVAGRWRTILGSSPKEMDVPIKVDEELYFEGKFDTEAMLNMLEKKVLEPAGVDYSSIKIRYMGKGQEAAKNIEHVPEQDACLLYTSCYSREPIQKQGSHLSAG